MAKWEDFRTCPGCGYDFGLDTGERSCHYGRCPYIPEELNVLCDQCRFDFYTMEGNPSCQDPATCEHGAEARGQRRERSGMARDVPPPDHDLSDQGGCHDGGG